MNSLTIVILLIIAVLIFILPRRFVLIPILFSGIILPMSERIYIADLDFTAIRILLVFGWVRLIIKSEYRSISKFNNIDKIIIIYILWSIVAYTILWQTVGALIYRLGFASYVLGTYFLVRFYIIDIDDIELLIKAFLFLVIIIAIFVVIERITSQNYFSFLGGVPYTTIIREGKLRCVGPFGHPITLGSFGAFLFSLAFYILLEKKKDKILGVVGLISSVVLVISSNSSGPFLSLLAVIFGLFMWLFRKHMRIIVWGVLISIVGLHIIMKAPVWALINRVGVFSSSSTYHRFLIVDQLISRFDEWWLIGVQSTENWDKYVQLTDVSNNYARVAVDGGILALILFITIIVLCFRHIGKMINLSKNDINTQKMFWTLGVAMFSYTISFIGVSLWDQTILIWYFFIATIASITYRNRNELQTNEMVIV